MISASSQLKDIFYNSRTVNISAGCTIEYNMNTLLDNITISTTITDADYTADIDSELIEKRINPFKKLFPIDSVLKPFRPLGSGIKYYVGIDSDHQGDNRFYDYRTVPYPSSNPRVYYPGVTTSYKYWVTPQNMGINATVKYVQDTATVNEAYATGSKIVYKTTANHGFIIGQRITITGSGTSSWNLTNQIITDVPDSRTFEVTNALAKSEEYGLSKTATLVNSSGIATPTKPALANKIVVKFEKYHSLPSTCTIGIDYNDATTDITLSPISVPSNGILEVYYNGTTWSTTPPFSSSQAITYPGPKEIKSITISTPAAGAGKIIGLIEISARWIKDISADVVSFDISKESTSSVNDILPVGNITANSLNLSLARYDQSNLKVLTYNRDDAWTVSPTPNDVIYFAKNAEITPHLKVYHSNGAVTEGSLKYDRVKQGTFYLDSHSISQFGDVQINGLDGSKRLMESLVPDLIYEKAPVTSIISSILDSIGFSNYNINVKLNESNEYIDTSVPNCTLWWSEKNKTVWDSIQELCRDVQMNAYFDENNVLQFYSRDYLYSKTTVDWEFYYEQSGNKLANIIEFNKQELASANQVKVIWKTPMSSLYTQSASDLWASEPSFLISGGLRKQIDADTPAENVIFDIDIDNLDPFAKFESTFNYSGYFLVNSEIFEYDAIYFDYEPLDSSTSQEIPIGSSADWSKYRALSKTGSEYFKPNGKYRIKARGVFGTEKKMHPATSSVAGEWYQVEDDIWNGSYVATGSGAGTLNPSINQQKPPKVKKVTSTSISVAIDILGITVTSPTYKIIYQRMTDLTTSSAAAQTLTSAFATNTITGLTANSLYKITTQITNPSGEGNTKTVYYNLSSNVTTPSKVSAPKGIGEKITAKSYLKLTGGLTSDNNFTFAYRDFQSVQPGTYTSGSYGAAGFVRSVRNYSPGYYSFGTSIIMPPLIKYQPQGAGIGFFLDEQNDSGYFIFIETTATSASINTSPIKIVKLENKNMKRLQDSQKGNRATLDQLFAGKVYNLDVKVKIENKTVTITAYINGFKVEATDTTSATSSDEILYPTERVALVGISGTTMFDYVYADTIQKEKYDDGYQSLNFYNGQFNRDFLNLAYGDIIYNASNDDVDIEAKKNAFDEFGTVVREIAKRSVSFNAAPAVPVFWTTGGNKLAQIIGQSYDNFKGEVFVLNNSSITIPLSDRGINQLSIFGNTIGFSGDIEYTTSAASEYAVAEPVIFESNWLQNENDVKSLADWIQGRVVNKAKIVEMKIFGNALISVGDIITIDYSYQGFTSSQKIIVVKVSQRYQKGLETEIVGRTL